MTRLYLVRHGQTLWNLEGRLQGWMDSDLSERGVLQAQLAKERLKSIPFDAIYSSDRGRAYSTAQIISDESLEIEKLMGLREMSFGEWEGHLVEDVKAKYPSQFKALFNQADAYISVGGESYEALRARVIPVLNDIERKHKNQSVLIVAHALTIKTILSYYGDISFKEFWHTPLLEGGSVSIVDVSDASKIIAYGDASHLGEILNNRKSV